MKFRILDLIFATAAIGLLFGMFQKDLCFFRQLSFFAFVACGSTLTVISFAPRRRFQRWIGAAGGLLAAIVFAGLMLVLLDHTYPTEFEIWQASAAQPMVTSVFHVWLLELVGWMLIAAPLGAALGPLFALRARQQNIKTDLFKPFWLSLVLLAATFIFGLMAMDDRVSMQQPNRNWTPIQLLFLVAFILHTLHWVGKTGATSLEDQQPREAVIENG